MLTFFENNTAQDSNEVKVAARAYMFLTTGETEGGETVRHLSNRLRHIVNDMENVKNSMEEKLLDYIVNNLEPDRLAQVEKDEAAKIASMAGRKAVEEFFSSLPLFLAEKDIMRIDKSMIPDFRTYIVVERIKECDSNMHDIIVGAGAALGAALCGKLMYHVAGKAGAIGGGLLGAFIGSAGGSAMGDTFLEDKTESSRREECDYEDACEKLMELFRPHVREVVELFAAEVERLTGKIAAICSEYETKSPDARTGQAVNENEESENDDILPGTATVPSPV